MIETIMNVTPAEFKEIWEVWSGEMSDAEAVSFMENYYGCRRYHLYRVVVRKDVPHIPMMSWGVKRFEEVT